jgi:hypothetical protein
LPKQKPESGFSPGVYNRAALDATFLKLHPLIFTNGKIAYDHLSLWLYQKLIGPLPHSGSFKEFLKP